MFWIPLIGPILQGVSSIFTGYFNKEVQVTQIQADENVAEAKVSQQIIQTTQDDISLRIIRDAAIVPVVVWMTLITWDTIVALRYPYLRFHVADFPKNVGYIPYIVLVFLFGNIGLNIWKRK